MPASWLASPNISAPRPLQVNTRAPAASWPERRSDRSSPAVAASRTWNWTTAPTGTSAATASEPASRSAPSRPRMRKSPRPKSNVCSSTTITAQQSLGGERPLDRVERGHGFHEAVEGGTDASSRITWRSALVTVKGCPIGRQPCETTVAGDTDGSSRRPTAPCETTRDPTSRRLPPGPRAAEAMPPITGQARIDGADHGQQVLDRGRERVRHQHERSGALQFVQGETVEPPTLLGGLGGDVQRGGAPAEPGGPERDARALLHAAPSGQDAPGSGADQHIGVEDGLHGRGHVLERAGAITGHEQDRYVRRPTEALTDIAHDLADRAGGDRMLGQRRGEGHVSLRRRRAVAAA